MHLLDATGTLNPVNQSVTPTDVLPGDTPPDELDTADLSLDTIIIEFASYADGRGFSLARYLRGHLQYQGKLQACGGLIPDQVTLAFQCGFDGILLTDQQLDQYATDFTDAVTDPAVTLSYRRSWEQRLPT